jgi:hypothetical protein
MKPDDLRAMTVDQLDDEALSDPRQVTVDGVHRWAGAGVVAERRAATGGEPAAKGV